MMKKNLLLLKDLSETERIRLCDFSSKEYIDKLDNTVVNKYNNAYHITINM